MVGAWGCRAQRRRPAALSLPPPAPPEPAAARSSTHAQTTHPHSWPEVVKRAKDREQRRRRRAARAAAGDGAAGQLVQPAPPPPLMAAPAPPAPVLPSPAMPAWPAGPLVAAVFPGQGAQAVGMLKEASSLPAVQGMLAKAKAVLGYDLLEAREWGGRGQGRGGRAREGWQGRDAGGRGGVLQAGRSTVEGPALPPGPSHPFLQVCLHGPQAKLDATAVAQPALFVAGLAAAELFRETCPADAARVTAAAGLSLGEYCALVYAGALSFEDGLQAGVEWGARGCWGRRAGTPPSPGAFPPAHAPSRPPRPLPARPTPTSPPP